MSSAATTSVFILTLLVTIFQSTACIKQVNQFFSKNNSFIKTILSTSDKAEINPYVSSFLNWKTNVLSAKGIPRRASNSQYLYDIYNLSVDEIKVPAAYYNISDQDRATINESDLISTYKSLSDCEHNSLWFDLSETPTIDRLIKAELRIHWSSVYRKGRVLKLYQPTSDNSASFVDAAQVPRRYRGWIKFDVTHAVRHWLGSRSVDLLHLLVLPAEKRQGNRLCDYHEPERRSFLVGYFKQSARPSVIFDRVTRSKRSLDSLLQLDSDGYDQAPESSGSCRLQSMYVSFQELEFYDIVYPEGYEARYCSGHCLFPLKANSNASNHAIVQTYVHFIRSDQAPPAQCAPDRLTDLPVICNTSNGDTIYVVYRNMTAQSCGCQ